MQLLEFQFWTVTVTVITSEINSEKKLVAACNPLRCTAGASPLRCGSQQDIMIRTNPFLWKKRNLLRWETGIFFDEKRDLLDEKLESQLLFMRIENLLRWETGIFLDEKPCQFSDRPKKKSSYQIQTLTGEAGDVPMLEGHCMRWNLSVPPLGNTIFSSASQSRTTRP